MIVLLLLAYIIIGYITSVMIIGYRKATRRKHKWDSGNDGFFAALASIVWPLFYLTCVVVYLCCAIGWFVRNIVHHDRLEDFFEKLFSTWSKP